MAKYQNLEGQKIPPTFQLAKKLFCNKIRFYLRDYTPRSEKFENSQEKPLIFAFKTLPSQSWFYSAVFAPEVKCMSEHVIR